MNLQSERPSQGALEEGQTRRQGNSTADAALVDGLRYAYPKKLRVRHG